MRGLGNLHKLPFAVDCAILLEVGLAHSRLECKLEINDESVGQWTDSGWAGVVQW